MAFQSMRARAGALAIVLAVGVVALPVKASAFDDSQRQEIEQIVREYLLANPELMLEIQDALEQKQAAQRVASQKKVLSEQNALIFSSRHQIEIGKPDAPVTVVEFFDYNCGFCQRALGDMNQLVDGGNVRFVMKEFPILSPQSVEAHKISIAFSKMMPEKAAEFHRSLLGAQGRKDGDVALELAVSMGADRDAIKKAAEEREVIDAIREAHMLAEGLGITGTPSYVIGDEVVFGAVGLDALSAKIANIGECGKATC